MKPTLLDPGQLTARLYLEAPDGEGDGQGGVLSGWRAVCALWAAIEPLSQNAYEEASAEGMIVTHRIWTAYRRDVNAGMRLRKGARLFAIRSVADPDETGRFIVCRCEEDSR